MNINLLLIVNILLLNEITQGKFLLVKLEQKFAVENSPKLGQFQGGKYMIEKIEKYDGNILKMVS